MEISTDSVDHIVDRLISDLVHPRSFLRPTCDTYSTSTDAAKYFFDALAQSIGTTQQTRQKINRKRKRAEIDDDSREKVLQLKQLYVDGFSPDQIWEQAAQILKSTEAEIRRDYAVISLIDKPTQSKAISPTGSESEQADDLSESAGSLDGTSEFEESFGDEVDTELDVEPGSASEDASGIDDAEDNPREVPLEQENVVYTQDPFGLNDGFFSIDEFNKQSEMFEKHDAKRASEDEESDDDQIDWHADPLISLQAKSAHGKSSLWQRPIDQDERDAMHESEDDGLTFGDADLNGAPDAEEDEMGSLHGGDNADWMNTNDVRYDDFFAPPARKAQSKRFRALPKTQPDITTMEDDLERAMADVRRDLFEDEVSGDEGPSSNETADDSRAPKSTHERQRARIADEIRRLEAANVAKKEWMLAGEARAVERPINSLLEEDLDFERVGKPVPVATNEASEEIEELVKRRIIAREFDEVIRRRPGVPGRQERIRDRFELDDGKPQQSLAELYETEHLKANDPNYVDPKNQKLSKQHAEITALWKEISPQLDTLSNWHYKPKAPQASINVISDVATITMEDARPTVGSAINGQGALAPQEIYAPGDDGKVAGEIVLKSGISMAKEEMTREEKARRRRRQKTKQKKGSSSTGKKATWKESKNQQLVSYLHKGGVKVIGEQGEITDVHGRKTNERTAGTGAGTLKL